MNGVEARGLSLCLRLETVRIARQLLLISLAHLEF